MTRRLSAALLVAVIGSVAPACEQTRPAPATPPGVTQTESPLPVQPGGAPSAGTVAAPSVGTTQELAAYFETELRDEAWAPARETVLRDALQSEGAKVLRTDCKKTLCRIVLSFDSKAALETFRAGFYTKLALPLHRTITAEGYDAAALAAELFISRPGCGFPRADGTAHPCDWPEVTVVPEAELGSKP